MASPGFCKVEGEVQGLITSDTLGAESVGVGWREDHRDEFMFQEFVQEVHVPHHAGGRNASSRRVYEPVRIVKSIDKCSPLLHDALKNNEILTKVEFTFFRTSAEGVSELYYKITLEHASVSSIRNHMPDVTDPANATLVPTQEVAFVYEKILVEHVLASTSSEDSWGESGL